MKYHRKPHSYKKKKPIYHSRFFRLGLLIFILLFSLFYFLFFFEFFQVEKIIITGENRVSTDDIRLAVESRLENRILFLKTKSIFLINLREAKKDILEQFPQIAKIEIKRMFPDALQVITTERLESIVYCFQEKCFLCDNEGIIFEEVTEEADLLRVVDKEKTEIPYLGDKVIEKENLSRIASEINPEIESELDIPVEEFIISSEDKLIVLTGEGWEIYLDLNSDIVWQLTKLRADLEEKIPPEKRKDLEYIELRFGNFAPFKYK